MNQLKNKNCHTFGTDPKSNRKIDTPKTQIHDLSRSLVCTYILTKGDGDIANFMDLAPPPPSSHNPLLVKLTDPIFTSIYICIHRNEFSDSYRIRDQEVRLYVVTIVDFSPPD
jgi:hypothetical protein